MIIKKSLPKLRKNKKNTSVRQDDKKNTIKSRVGPVGCEISQIYPVPVLSYLKISRYS